jgi:regulatory protein
MAGKITALKFQKKDPDRVSVYLDGHFAFGLPAIVAARLLLGQFLSDPDIEALQEQGQAESAYNRALNYLSYRPRSRWEVVTYLQGKGLPAEQVEGIVDRLEAAGLLDDEAFAQFWVENRGQFRPRGLRGLRYELQRKGISDAVIDRAVASVDASAGAYQAAASKARQLDHLDRATFRRKLIEYLARRGFDYEIAQETAERCWVELTAGEG